MQIDREREGRERKREKTRSGTNVKDLLAIGWCGWLAWLQWLAGQGCAPPQDSTPGLFRRSLHTHTTHQLPPTNSHPPPFSTTRLCLREREEREYAGTGEGGEGSHPHGTPSFQVEVFGVGQDFGLRFSVRVCSFLLCLFFWKAKGSNRSSARVGVNYGWTPFRSHIRGFNFDHHHPPTPPWLEVVRFWVPRPSLPPAS